MMLTSLKKMSLKIFERFCEHDLNKRKNTKNSRISYNKNDRFQYQNVKIHNKNDLIVQISHQ